MKDGIVVTIEAKGVKRGTKIGPYKAIVRSSANSNVAEIEMKVPAAKLEKAVATLKKNKCTNIKSSLDSNGKSYTITGECKVK